MCFNEIFYFFFFLTIISAHIGSIRGLFRSVLDRIRPIWGCFSPFQTESDRIGPNWTVLENQKKKKKFGHRCACSRVHGRTARPCISDLGAPAQSVQPCFWDGHLFLGFVLILGFQRGYCFSNHYDCSINPNLVYIVCPYLDCISWFFIRNRCFRKLEFFKFLNFHGIRNMDRGCYLYIFYGFDIYQTKH